MTNKLEPAESFGPDPALVCFWLILTSLPFFFSVFLIIRDGPRSDLLEMILASPILPIIVVVFTSRFRATFNADSFVYRRWGPTVRVRYADISRIETTNTTPIEKQAIGAFTITKQNERFPFWPKLFPRQAVMRFFQLAIKHNFSHPLIPTRTLRQSEARPAANRPALRPKNVASPMHVPLE
jgi:hypothetical protein